MEGPVAPVSVDVHGLNCRKFASVITRCKHCSAGEHYVQYKTTHQSRTKRGASIFPIRYFLLIAWLRTMQFASRAPFGLAVVIFMDTAFGQICCLLSVPWRENLV